MSNLITRTPQLIAAEINDIKKQTQRMLLYNSIEIGRRLTEAKLMVDHGEWGNWLETSVEYSKSTANNLMRIFDEYGADQITLLDNNVKNEAFSKLTYSQAVALLGVPEEEREAFVKDNDVENMSTRELQEAIKAKEAAEEKAKKAENRAKKAEDDAEKSKSDVKKKEQEVQTLAVKLLEAQESGSQEEVTTLEEALKKVSDQLEKEKSRAVELENKLKEKPVQVQVIQEIIPEAIQSELEELRKKAGQAGDETAAQFKVYFEVIKKDFESLLAFLQGVNEPEKYKGAAAKLLDLLKQKLA